MKKFVFLVLLTVALVAPAAYAQSTTDDVEITRSDIQADRKAIVAANLGLTDAEGTAFWPVYNAYRLEMRSRPTAWSRSSPTTPPPIAATP